MKLRIKGNSIRMRLSQGDVKTLQELGEVWDSTQFPSMRSFKYGIVSSAAPEIHVRTADFRIRLDVPLYQLEKWFDPAEVTISNELQLPGDKKLEILVEKDFQCLTTRPGEDESDLFPNPLEKHG